MIVANVFIVFPLLENLEALELPELHFSEELVEVELPEDLLELLTLIYELFPSDLERAVVV